MKYKLQNLLKIIDVLFLLLTAVFLSSCSGSESDPSGSLCTIIIILSVVIYFLVKSFMKDENITPSVSYTTSDNARVTELTATKIITSERSNLAKQVISNSKLEHNISLDLSLGSVPILKDILSLIKKKIVTEKLNTSEINDIIENYGTFLGEIIRNKWGGEWHSQLDKLKHNTSVFVFSKNIKLDPFEPIRKYIVNNDFSAIDKFIELSKELLDYSIPTEDDLYDQEYDPDIDDAQKFPSDIFEFIYYWPGKSEYCSDISSVVEGLQLARFPFNHKTIVSLKEIIIVPPEKQERPMMEKGRAYTLRLAPYVFEKEFVSTKGGKSNHLILSAYSKRKLVNMMLLSGFIIDKDTTPSTMTTVDSYLNEIPVELTWICPKCQTRNSNLNENDKDIIVSCKNCKSSFRYVSGVVLWENCRTSRYMSIIEFFWSVRLSIGFSDMKEITFKTENPDLIIREKDILIVLLSKNRDGVENVEMVENRITQKIMIF